MVKIAPDKSLPQTKNRGQRLTLTIARQQALMEKTESARYLGDAVQGTKLLNSMRFTLDLARHHLQRLESEGWIRNATASESRPRSSVRRP